MTALLTAAALLLAQPAAVDDWRAETTARVITGDATFMAETMMAKAAMGHGFIDDWRDWPGWLESRGFAGAVALNRAGDIGRAVWLDGPNGLEGPFFVADCAGRDAYAWRVAAGRVVEVDWQTAQAWGMNDLVPVTVWLVMPLSLMFEGPHRPE